MIVHFEADQNILPFETQQWKVVKLHECVWQSSFIDVFYQVSILTGFDDVVCLEGLLVELVEESGELVLDWMMSICGELIFRVFGRELIRRMSCNFSSNMRHYWIPDAFGRYSPIASITSFQSSLKPLRYALFRSWSCADFTSCFVTIFPSGK